MSLSDRRANTLAHCGEDAPQAAGSLLGATAAPGRQPDAYSGGIAHILFTTAVAQHGWDLGDDPSGVANALRVYAVLPTVAIAVADTLAALVLKLRDWRPAQREMGAPSAPRR
jgi:hypothetical protein